MSQQNLMNGGDCRQQKKGRGYAPAVYHVALYFWNSGQNVFALNFGGIMTVPPECNGARNPARRPWTWNSGITKYDRSDIVSLYVLTIFFIVVVRFRCVNGTATLTLR